MKRGNTRPVAGRIATCAVVASAVPAAALAAVPQYRIVDIGTLGGDQTWGVAINDAGQVTGGSTTAEGDQHAFLYADGAMSDLGTLGGVESFGNAINDAGQVTGWAESKTARDAFLYRDGALVDLGNLGGGYSEGLALNNAGQVTGLSGTRGSSGNYDAFLYSAATGKMVDLGTLGDSYSEGDAINDAGAVVGTYAANFSTHVFLHMNGAMRDLVPSDFSYVAPGARAINSNGDVVGSYGKLGLLHAFLYRNGAAIDLGTLGGTSSFGQAVNAAGDVTGYSTTPAGDQHAFLYSNGVLRDLGAGGGDFSEGVALNDSGEVVGTADVPGSGSRAFVYANGATTLLDAAELGALESYGIAINDGGEVVGQYTVPDDPYEPLYRTFLATPITLLFSRLEERAARLEHGRSIAMEVRLAATLYTAEAVPASCAMLRFVAHEANARARPRSADSSVAQAVGVIEDALDCAEEMGRRHMHRPPAFGVRDARHFARGELARERGDDDGPTHP